MCQSNRSGWKKFRDKTTWFVTFPVWGPKTWGIVVVLVLVASHRLDSGLLLVLYLPEPVTFRMRSMVEVGGKVVDLGNPKFIFVLDSLCRQQRYVSSYSTEASVLFQTLFFPLTGVRCKSKFVYFFAWHYKKLLLVLFTLGSWNLSHLCLICALKGWWTGPWSPCGRQMLTESGGGGEGQAREVRRSHCCGVTNDLRRRSNNGIQLEKLK